MKISQPAGWFGRTGTVFFGALLVLISVNGRPSVAVGDSANLAPCPGRPNCVCSDDLDPDRRVEPLMLAVSPAVAWESLRTLVSSLPRTTVVMVGERDLHAEAKSRLFGFVDDVVFQLRPSEKIIAVRSASRTGFSDFGVNRKRVEDIRRRLRKAGVVD